MMCIEHTWILWLFYVPFGWFGFCFIVYKILSKLAGLDKKVTIMSENQSKRSKA